MSLSFPQKMGRGPKILRLALMKTFSLPFHPSTCINVALIFMEVVVIWWLEFKVMFYSNKNQNGTRFPFHREPESPQE